MYIDEYYYECFNHIADPVQRNSVCQQWLQMVRGQLSIPDLRVLLDKYPDFRFAVENFVSNRISKLEYSDSLKQIADTLPEFKKLVNQRLETLRVQEENKVVNYNRTEIVDWAPETPDKPYDSYWRSIM